MMSSERLEGWKQIARYCNVSINTAKRYAKEAGLPVKKYRAARKPQYFAELKELENWRRAQDDFPVFSTASAGNTTASVSSTSLTALDVLAAMRGEPSQKVCLKTADSILSGIEQALGHHREGLLELELVRAQLLAALGSPKQARRYLDLAQRGLADGSFLKQRALDALASFKRSSITRATAQQAEPQRT